MPSKADTAVARTIGIDTGKNTLHMIGLDEKGAIVLREKVSRTRIAARFVNLPPCLVGIEAGMASHHVARELVAQRGTTRHHSKAQFAGPDVVLEGDAQIAQRVIGKYELHRGCEAEISVSVALRHGAQRGNRVGEGAELRMRKPVAQHPFQPELPQRVFYADGSVGDW